MLPEPLAYSVPVVHGYLLVPTRSDVISEFLKFPGEAYLQTHQLVMSPMI